MIAQDNFKIEKILDRRVKDNRVEYFIKWEGYSVKDSTWEPLQNMRKSLKAITLFEKEAKQALVKRRERRTMMSKYLMGPEEKENPTRNFFKNKHTNREPSRDVFRGANRNGESANRRGFSTSVNQADRRESSRVNPRTNERANERQLNRDAQREKYRKRKEQRRQLKEKERQLQRLRDAERGRNNRESSNSTIIVIESDEEQEADKKEEECSPSIQRSQTPEDYQNNSEEVQPPQSRSQYPTPNSSEFNSQVFPLLDFNPHCQMIVEAPEQQEYQSSSVENSSSSYHPQQSQPSIKCGKQSQQIIPNQTSSSQEIQPVTDFNKILNSIQTLNQPQDINLQKNHNENMKVFVDQLDSFSLKDFEDDIIYIVLLRNGSQKRYTGAQLKRKSSRKVASFETIVSSGKRQRTL